MRAALREPWALAALLLAATLPAAYAQAPVAAATPDAPVNVRAPTPLPVYGNPIIRDKYPADPAALVHQGTVYLYTGHDNPPPARGGTT